MSFTLAYLAEQLGGSFTGDAGLELLQVAKIEEAIAGEVTFLANPKYSKYLETTNASAVILRTGTELTRDGIAAIYVDDPYIGFVKSLRLFESTRELFPPGIHDSAVIAVSAVIGEGVHVGACAVIGSNARIGDRTKVCAGAVVGDNALVGSECIIYPNASVLHGCVLGDRVIIHAGATIGSDGFGFAPSGKTYEKIPQLGNVVIGSDVEIGANSTVDRATIGSTRVRRGVKIDNLVQVAHNVDIGEDTVIAAQSGISGSTTVGTHVTLAGQVGVVGHIEIADDVIVTAQSGVSKSLTETGKMYRGSPAKDFKEELKMEAAVRQLPDLIRTVRELQKQIETLKAASVVE